MAGRSSEYAATQDAAASQSGDAVGGGCTVCHDGNWIHVRYEYTEGDPVGDAVYVVQKPDGGDVIKEGVLSIGPNAQHEFVHVDLEDHSGPVEVFFIDDPTEPNPYEEEAPVTDERGWFRKAADGVLAGANWGWDVVQGDFNENMTTGQIVTNALVTAIPVVDQVADGRDLVANGKLLIWDKRYNEIGVWVGVFACLIGLVPSLGSLAKGVIKLIWKNAAEMGRVIIYINKGLHKSGLRINGYRFVKKLADDVVSQVGFVAGKFDDFLNTLVEKISLARRVAPDRVAEALATIEHIRGLARSKFDEAAQAIRAKILSGMAQFAAKAARVLPKQSVTIRRAVTAVVDAGPFKNWQAGMSRPIDINTLEKGARDISPEDTLRFNRLLNEADVWTDELLSRTDLPASISSLPRSVIHSTMTTFGSKPTLKVFADDETMDVYRVIGKDSQKSGPFWSRSIPPDTEEAWRARDAVLNEWNDASAYVKSTIPPPDAILVGEIGPQDLGKAAKAPKPGKMLEGGGEQIWMPRHASGPDTRVSEYFYTNWSAPVAVSRSTVRLGRISECDK